jgi:AcrR family transcriptional regulator
MEIIENKNTEQIILEAAEKLFLDKGYAATKTTEIAQEAGINHAMLHYYFRTKENLFNKIFETKAQYFLSSFSHAFDQELPLREKIKLGVETHFDFIGTNPKIPMFIMREIVSNKEKREFLLRFVHQDIIPKAFVTINELTQAIKDEVEKGNIQPINPIDLILNIASLNVFAYVTGQVFFDTDETGLKTYLEQRKKNNVEVILKSLFCKG